MQNNEKKKHNAQKFHFNILVSIQHAMKCHLTKIQLIRKFIVPAKNNSRLHYRGVGCCTTIIILHSTVSRKPQTVSYTSIRYNAFHTDFVDHVIFTLKEQTGPDNVGSLQHPRTIASYTENTDHKSIIPL